MSMTQHLPASPPPKKKTKTKTTRNDATPSLFPPVLQSDGSIEEWQQWGNRKRFRIYIVLWHAHINAPQWWRDDILTRTLFPNSGCLQVERSAICPPPNPLPQLPQAPTTPPAHPSSSCSSLFSRFQCKAYNLCELFSLLTSAGI